MTQGGQIYLIRGGGLHSSDGNLGCPFCMSFRICKKYGDPENIEPVRVD